MALGGLNSLGPINYYDSMVPDFRGEALKETQNAYLQTQNQVLRNDMRAQQAAGQEQAKFQQAFSAAYQSNNPEVMQALVAQYPSQIKTIRDSLDLKDGRQAAALGSAANDLMIARKTGSPEAMAAALVKNAGVLQQHGASPQEAMKMYLSDPAQFDSLLGGVRMATLPMDKQFDVQNNQDKLAETIRSNRAGEGLQARGQNISAQNAVFDRELRRAELADKNLDRQIARETNQVRLDDLRLKQEENRANLERTKADRTAVAKGAIDTFGTALSTLDDLSKSPGLTRSVGINSAFPTIPGTEAANFEAKLDTFKAQSFLPMVQSLKGMGALSDAEGKKLNDAVGALSPKMSEAAFRKSVDVIKSDLERKMNAVRQQYGYQEPTKQSNAPQVGQAEGGYIYLGGPPGDPSSWRQQ